MNFVGIDAVHDKSNLLQDVNKMMTHFLNFSSDFDKIPCVRFDKNSLSWLEFGENRSSKIYTLFRNTNLYPYFRTQCQILIEFGDRSSHSDVQYLRGLSKQTSGRPPSSLHLCLYRETIRYLEGT